MTRRWVLPLLLLAAAVPPAGPGRARAAYGPGAVISIDAEDAPDVDEPFRPPVVFTLKPGAADEPVLSPEGDTRFLDGVARWQIQVFDFDGKKVDWIQGLGKPRSARIEWDGMGRNGQPLKDAFYSVRFVWQDRAGAAHASEPIKVGLLTPPGLQDLVSPNVRLAYSADGMTIRVSEQLTFDAGSVALRPGAEQTLERIADFLQQYPTHRLLVLGHADAVGTDSYNLAISTKRAQAIYRFLLSRGVAEERVTYQGLGASKPLATNETAEGRRQNRRVEIVLLKATI